MIRKIKELVNSRIGASVLATSVFLALALGLVVANTLTKQREFKGSVLIEVHKKGDDGRWEIIDRLNAQSLQFTASVADLAQGKQVTSNHVWEGQTAQGRRLSVRLARPGSAQFDLATGKLDIDVVFSFSLDGEATNLPVKLTTESISTPSGSINGRRAQINRESHTATLALVGLGKLRVRNEIIGGSSEGGGTESKRPTKGPTELFLVFKGDGTLTAKNGSAAARFGQERLLP